MSKKEQMDRLVRVIKIEGGYPCALDWSPDGTRLLVGDSTGGVQVFTAEGTRLWRSVEHTGSVYGVSWAPDGGHIASSSSRPNTIRVYDAASGTVLLRGEAGNGNWKITWSPTSDRLAWFVQKGETDIVRIFDAANFTPLMDCTGHTWIVWCVSWSPQGNLLASGAGETVIKGRDTTIRLWDPRDGSCLQCLEGHTELINGLGWSPDGIRLASASKDKTVRVWDTRTGACLFVCDGHENHVWSVSWSPDGRILASGSSDKTVRLWDAHNGKEILRLDNPDRILSVAFSPNGSLLAWALGDGPLKLWNVSDLTKSKFENDFDKYIIRQASTIGLRPYAVKEKKEHWVPQLPESKGDCLGVLRGPIDEDWGLSSLAMFQNGQSIVTGHVDGIVRCWDLKRGVKIWEGNQQIKSGINDINCVAVSSDGTRIATGSYDKTMRIWGATNGRCLFQCSGHKERVFKVCWSPDGKRLASISDDKSVRFWDAATGKCLKICKGHQELPTALGWSHNGQFISTGDIVGNIFIWDTNKGKCIRNINLQDSAIWDLCWSPDNHYIFTGSSNGTVLVLDTSSGSTMVRCEGHSTNIPTLDLSSDGRFIATGAGENDRTIRVWDAQSGKELKRFRFSGNYCQKIAWSPDNGFIVSSHSNDILRFWDTRNLLPEESVTAAIPSSIQRILITAQMRFLPSALAQMHRLNIFPPLSLLSDMLDLLADHCEVESLRTLMAGSNGIQGLRDLHWPAEARLGLAALLLHRLPPSEWQPPQNTTTTQVRDALIIALSWESMEPQPPSPPISLLTQVVDQIDDRLVSLLSMLGPGAVAADPGLPLRLLPRVKDIPALSITQRRLLGVRISTSGVSGKSTGRAPGVDRVQVGDIEMGPLRSDFTSLLPSQLAMPSLVQMYRHLRNELLFRAREMAEPPRLRPCVILLDVSPPTFGPIEKIIRLAAFTVGQSLRRAGLPVILLCNSDGINKGQWLLELHRPSDLIETWLQRTLKPIPAARNLELARVLRAGLQENEGLEPIILVLSHPWYGADEKIPEMKGLRGLFVQYPHYPVVPVLAGKCEKWKSIETTQIDELTPILAQLMT